MMDLKPEDREFIREELAWLADWIRRKYPGLNYRRINGLLRTRELPLSV